MENYQMNRHVERWHELQQEAENERAARVLPRQPRGLGRARQVLGRGLVAVGQQLLKD